LMESVYAGPIGVIYRRMVGALVPGHPVTGI
jgi:hypothetical protein